MNRTLLVRSATLALLAAAPAVHAAPTHTQSFTLRPGWNAIYLEIAPPAADPGAVFRNLPLLSVWTWNPKTTSAEFIQDPSEAAFSRAGWLGYFPPGPLSGLTNLFAIQANRAYLVRIGGNAPVTLTVTGRPSVRGTSWVANGLNLVGFHVDPAAPPTFASFLASSPAHAGQAIYRLGPDGIWAPLAASARIQSGEAYWVYCSGASSFTAPTWVELSVGDGLDYSQSLVEQTLTIRNSGADAGVSLGLLASANLVPLTYWQLSATTSAPAWPPLPSRLTLAVAAQGTETVRLAVKRANLGGTVGESVMEVKDGRGTRILIPVSVQPLAGVTRLLVAPGAAAPFAATGETPGPLDFDLRGRAD